MFVPQQAGAVFLWRWARGDAPQRDLASQGVQSRLTWANLFDLSFSGFGISDLQRLTDYNEFGGGNI